MDIKHIALIGMGAVGTVYGKLLYDQYGPDFTVIASGSRAEKLKTNGITLNKQTFFPRVISAQDDHTKADLLIVCVKNYQLDNAIEDMRPFVGDRTVILPLLNGVTSSDRLSAAFPNAKVLYGLCVQIDAVRQPDGVVNTNEGIVQFGYRENTDPAPEVLGTRDILKNAGINAQICPDMMRAIWKKWMLNVGVNQVSAVTRAPYGKIMSLPSNRILFHEAMMEVVALAKAAHIDLTEQDALEFETMLSTFSPYGKTSMLQDVEAKRKTEVDYFSGTVEKLGKKYHVPTPVNHVLFQLIRSIEQSY